VGILARIGKIVAIGYVAYTDTGFDPVGLPFSLVAGRFKYIKHQCSGIGQSNGQCDWTQTLVSGRIGGSERRLSDVDGWIYQH